MFANLNLTRKGLVLVLVPILFEVLFVTTLASMLSSASHEFAQVEHASDILIRMHEFDSALTHRFAQANAPNLPKAERLQRIDSLLKTLSSTDLVPNKKEYPELAPVLEELESLRVQFVHILKSVQENVRRNPDAMAGFSVPPEQEAAIFLQAQTINRELVQIEERLRSSQPEQLEQTRWTLLELLIAGLFFSATASIAVAYFFSNDISKRLKAIASNAERIATGESLLPLRRDASDEIAELDLALHQANRLLQDVRRKELAIIENAADIICSLDAKLRFRAISPVVSRLWKYVPEDLLGMSLLTMVATDDLEAARTAYTRIQEHGDGEIENVIVTKDGKTKNLLWKISWSKEEEAYFCVVHDVTELRAIEKMKRHFIAIVSHDLRTPLTSVGVCLTFLLSGRRGFVPDEVRKLLELAQKSASRLMELVNELLELEKLGSGKFLLNPVAISMSDVCAAARESVQTAADSAGVRIKGPVGDALGYADQNRMVQVVTYLLANAIRYSPMRSTIQLSIVRDTPTTVRLEVADAGPKIPVEERNSVFDKFQRPEGSEKQTLLKTSGLALAIVKAIVEAHGGQVGIDPDLKEGRLFWVSIPRHKDDEEDDV